MIDGRQWHEIDFLWNHYKQMFDESLVDEEFRLGTFEKAFRAKARRLINQWTAVDIERNALLQDMVDCAVDERSML